MENILNEFKKKNLKLKIVYNVSNILLIIAILLLVINFNRKFEILLLLIALAVSVIGSNLEKTLIREINNYVKNNGISEKNLKISFLSFGKNNPIKAIKSKNIEEFNSKLNNLYNKN